jgi:hypothetical protein
MHKGWLLNNQFDNCLFSFSKGRFLGFGEVGGLGDLFSKIKLHNDVQVLYIYKLHLQIIGL